ncbi:Uma2 family endonuclease [Candidatus Poribacteria bacterium]|nr:Uma2 family endonuclease [Candidatus Poribacteria bacterium]
MSAIEPKAAEVPFQPLLSFESKPLPKGKISFEEFLDWCDEDTWAEWEDGEVILMSPAANRHQQIGGFLETLLRIYTERNQLGLVFSAPFLMRLPFLPRGREPDLLYIATEHLSRLKDTYLDGPANVVVEIVSEESIDRDTNKKFTEYALGRVPEYWLINYLEEEATFYHLSEKGDYSPLPLEGGNLFRSQEIAGFWLRVDWLWQVPLPDTFGTLQALMPQLQSEALRQAEMRFRQEAAARHQEALARRQAEHRAQQEADARRQAEQRAQAEAIARRQAEQRAQAEATVRQQEMDARRQAEQRVQQAEAELDRLRAELEALRKSTPIDRG